MMRTERGNCRPLPRHSPHALLIAFILTATIPFFSLAAAGARPEEGDVLQGQNNPTPSPPQRKSSGPETPVEVLARNWEKTEKRIFAQGDVEVCYKDLKIFADEVEVNTETKDIFASGNVVIQLPNEVVSADKIFYNLDSRQGKIDKAFGMVRPNIFYQADTIERKDENTYYLTKAKLTSCTQPNPRWNFSCSKANFRKNDYIEMWNSVFRIKKVPVFYMPYFRYPLNQERSTGFLIPQIGYSGVKGFILGESFYWAIARNMDATVNADYYSSKGVGGGLEYRYLFGDGTGGEARVYYFVFKRGVGGVKSSNASIVRFNHNQLLPYGFRMVANVDYQTSFDFLREFDNNFKRASISNYRSEGYISRAWSYYNFSLRASRFETYFAGFGDSIITYYLPQATLSSFKIKLFSPLYFSFASSFTSWKYGMRSDYDAHREMYYDSVSFSPQLSLPFTNIPWLTVNSSLNSNFVYYAQSFAPNTRRIINDPIFRLDYTFETELTGPVFYRIFQSSQGTTKVKHLIEPSISYSYDSPVNDPERIISVSGRFRYYQLTYGLTNRILVKKDMPREIFTWGVSQTYYLSRDDSPLSIYRWKGEIPRLSDIASYLRFYPARKYSLDMSTGFNTYFKTFSFLRLAANLNSYSDPFFFSVNWFKSMNPWGKASLFNRQQIGAVGRINIPRLQLEALGEFDFNIKERKMLYSGVSLIYHYQCLDLKADVRVFYYRETPEVQYRVSIGLGNIGKSTDFMGGLGF